MKQDYEEYEESPSRLAWMIAGASIGALAMFLSDPDRGARRRALANDKFRSAMTKTGDAFGTASRDVSNRMHGMRAQAGRLFKRRGALDDDILIQRVRQQIGRMVSHPRAVKIEVMQGRVILHGPILAYEKQDLLDAIRHVSGVSEVEDRLEAHDSGEGIASLQGSHQKHVSSNPDSWSPAARALALTGGGMIGAFGLARRGPTSGLLLAAGVALIARSLGNMGLSRMAGLATEGHAVSFSKSIHIEADPERVFDIWSDYENFPRFMTNVQEVQDLGNGRSHWTVRGPAGKLAEWDSRLTESRRGEILAWESEPGSMVQTSGSVRFERDGQGTRVTVHMSYTPPAGLVGHTAASVLAAGPKRQMEEDLLRMKAFIETGKPPHDAARSGQQVSATLH